MNYSDALAEMYKDGMDSLWRTVAAMPEEKLDWRPAETSRTARALLEEIVMTTGFSADLIKTMQVPEMTDGEEQVKTVVELEAAHRSASEMYLEAVANFQVDKLHEKIDLPWGNMDFLQVIAYPYWNLVYHWGQIGYIQTMYGDKEMH